MSALSSLDQVAYVRYASVYRNFREAKDFEAFVEKELVIRVVEAQGVWSNSVSSDDKRWMGAAISASWQAIGRTGVNPCWLRSDQPRW